MNICPRNWQPWSRIFAPPQLETLVAVLRCCTVDENEWQISLILLSHNKENGANFKLDELTFGYMCISARTSRGVIEQNKKLWSQLWYLSLCRAWVMSRGFMKLPDNQIWFYWEHKNICSRRLETVDNWSALFHTYWIRDIQFSVIMFVFVEVRNSLFIVA